MKILAVVLLVLLSACDLSDDYRTYFWTIERQGVAPDELQRRHNVMATHGWVDGEDDQLQQSGLYVYYRKTMRPSQATVELEKIRTELESQKR